MDLHEALEEHYYEYYSKSDLASAIAYIALNLDLDDIKHVVSIAENEAQFQSSEDSSVELTYGALEAIRDMQRVHTDEELLDEDE